MINSKKHLKNSRSPLDKPLQLPSLSWEMLRWKPCVKVDKFNIIRICLQLRVLAIYGLAAIEISSSFYAFQHQIEKATQQGIELSKTSFGLEIREEVLPKLNGAEGWTQRQLT